MRKNVFGRKLKRDTNARKALFRSLMQSLVLHGNIKTSEAKAKSIKGEVEKLVTHAKNGGDTARSLILSKIVNEPIADKIINEIAPLFTNRPGGYTRILRLGVRAKDGSRMVLLSWVEEVKPTSFGPVKRNKSGEKAKKAPKAEVKKEVKKVETKETKIKTAQKRGKK